MTSMELLPPTVCHSLHEKHELTLVTTRPSGFQCDGCKQFGQGTQHYQCEACDFDLHARCATAPAVIDHALFVGSRFALLDDHTTQNGDMLCHACGGKSVGLRYHSTDLNIYLHPCCAFLPTRVVRDGHAFELRNDAYRKCRICNKRSQSRSLSYRCLANGGGHVYLHVACLAKAHNAQTGYESWKASEPIMEAVLGTFTRKRDAAMKIAQTALDVVAELVVGVLSEDPGSAAEFDEQTEEDVDEDVEIDI